MTAIIPAVDPHLQLVATLQAHATGRPVPLLERRHIAIDDHAQVLTIIGLTGENVPVGFSLGDLNATTPHDVVLAGDPRDPALAVRIGAALADLLEPLIGAAIAGGPPLQLLVDSPTTADFLWRWSFRLRAPWLPGPYRHDATLQRQADRSQDAYALVRGLLAAAQVPGADVITDAVSSLTGHFTFPLAGEQEAAQLAVLLACLRHAGAPVHLPALGPATGSLLEQIEQAEQVALSAATDPEWDNRVLVPALTSFKRLRNAAARGNQLRRVHPTVVTAAARSSGLAAHVTAELTLRHQAVSQAFQILRLHPALPALGGRRLRALPRSQRQLQRGHSHDRKWRDFPALLPAALDAATDQHLTVQALIDAARGDRRVFALAQARGEATTGRVTSVSPDGRTVTLHLDRPLTPRSPTGWWWLDDTHHEPIIGDLHVDAGTIATLTVTKQMRRLAKTPTLVTRPHRIRLVCLGRAFAGQPWWPNSREAAATPGPNPWPNPIDFATLDLP